MAKYRNDMPDAGTVIGVSGPNDNPDPLLDPAGSGDMPHLMEYLLNSFVDYLRAEIRKRTEQDLPTITLEQAVMRTSAERFVRWAADHLQDHRVAEQFYVDENHGLKLSNGVTLTVSPQVDAVRATRGSMQDSGAVPVTRGEP